MTRLYVLALSTVAVLSIGAQWLIQRQLSYGESDSRVINVAGRQRMLSQKLAKSSLNLMFLEETKSAAARTELRITLEEWASSHRALQQGNEQRGLPGKPSQEVSDLFARIEPHFDTMRDAALLLASNRLTGTTLETEVIRIQENEKAFLLGMDAIVRQCVKEAENRVARLGRMEHVILALTLLVLLAEGIFIFRPAVRRISHTLERLASSSASLESARKQAEAANDAKTRFLANVSHELRTPMTAVLGMTELARSATDEGERERCLSVVDEAGKSLLGLLNDLIDVARIDADELRLASEAFDAFHPAEQSVRMLELSARQKGLDFYLESDGPEQAIVLGDSARILQVLNNLISNAIKWTDNGRVVVACEVRDASPDHANLKYTVTDTGVGIPASLHETVFEPFAQASRDQVNNRGGVGLGLAICRRITEAMGGAIRLDSKAGRGTTVVVELCLPLAKAPVPPQETGPPRVPNTNQLKVLVVEDTRLNQVYLESVLQSGGHTTTFADDGEAAVPIFERCEYDLAIIDLQLPGIDGEETARALRSIEAQQGRLPTPFICLTAHSPHEVSLDRSLFNAILSKPIDPRILENEISLAVAAPPEAPSDAMPSVQQELAIAFLQHYPSAVTELTEAVEAKDYQKVKVASHRLYGQVSYFENVGAAAVLKEIEDAAERKDPMGIAEKLPVAIRLTESLCTAISTQEPE